uniref:SH2 domain-containing protein n=1 Tax=Syphacia muris TaxID=451379 RepID=A0A0N5AT31_9BILA
MSISAKESPDYDSPLRLTSSNLSLEPWYHGKITRIRSESLVKKAGDFLVRDSISMPGDYVLTAFWKGRALHFQINKVMPRKNFGTITYQFEDEQFESIVDLITFYQAYQKPITVASECLIKNPVINICGVKVFDPVEDIEQNYSNIRRSFNNKPGFERCLSQQVLLNETRKLLANNRTASLSATNLSDNNENLNNHKQHFSLAALLSRPLPIPEKKSPDPAQSKTSIDNTPASASNQEQNDYCEMDYDAMEDTPADIIDAYSNKLYRSQQHTSLTSLNSIKPLSSVQSVPSMTQSCFDVSKLNWRLPRTESIPSLPERKAGCSSTRDSGFVTDTSDYDHPTMQKPGPSGICDATNHYSSFRETDQIDFNKYVRQLRNIMTSKGPSYCAELIMLEDCRLLQFLQNSQSQAKSKQNLNGLSLILLPQGAAIRERLIERARSLHFVCVLSILKVSDTFRGKILSYWIAIAQTLLKTYGNLFSFLTIVTSLCAKAILQKYSLLKLIDQSILDEFNTKLLPLAESLRKGNELPSEISDTITIPVIQPILDLLSSRPSSFFLDTANLSSQIESLWRWLELGRSWSVESDVYQKRAGQICRHQILDTDNIFMMDYYRKYLFCTNNLATLETNVLQPQYNLLINQINGLTNNLSSIT